MRLIDADKINFLWTPIAPIYILDDVHYESVAFKREIDAQPTIDPVKHAHWIFKLFPNDWVGQLYICSECNGTSDSQSRYCPHCGAFMQKGE